MDHAEVTEKAQERGEKRSLSDVHGTVEVPGENAGFWKNWRAFTGPAILVSVGYMDPGNWSTDLTAGAEYKYKLLWVVALSSLMAIVLQICAAKLGVVTGKDLAHMSHDRLPKWTRWPNWLATEVAIAACDLAEVLGSAVAIHLLFHLPIILGVVITAFDVMLLMALQGVGFRKVESLIFVLVSTIAACYFVELFIFGRAHGEMADIAGSLVKPGFPDRNAVLIAIGIIGATVMPHNLYLHSAIVQTRRFQKDERSISRAIKFNTLDSVLALTVAFFINAAILILAAMTFYGKHAGLTLPDGKPIGDDWIQGAYHTLSPLLGAGGASVLFAVALLASGQSSTITGTLAGQVVMEGFMSWKIRPWVRRLVTRLVAILPAIIVISIFGEGKVTDLLNWSQVILGIQLPMAMVPLMYFTSSRKIMGRVANSWWVMALGWTCVVVITGLDVYSIVMAIAGG